MTSYRAVSILHIRCYGNPGNLLCCTSLEKLEKLPLICLLLFQVSYTHVLWLQNTIHSKSYMLIKMCKR